ncbi:MAG: metal-dependent hydrolase [Bacteroidetes bacterium]|nr:metal-dependent hydrolase [Bacteroidota bacterium]
MDSITQFVLGAALGELVAGKKAGNKALFWGGVAGTIPDLDIVFSPLFTELENLSVHRGFSHSLVFGFLAAPVFGWLVSKIYRKPSAMVLKDWVKLFSGVFLRIPSSTHLHSMEPSCFCLLATTEWH